MQTNKYQQVHSNTQLASHGKNDRGVKISKMHFLYYLTEKVDSLQMRKKKMQCLAEPYQIKFCVEESLTNNDGDQM